VKCPALPNWIANAAVAVVVAGVLEDPVADMVEADHAKVRLPTVALAAMASAVAMAIEVETMGVQVAVTVIAVVLAEAITAADSVAQ